MKINENPTMIQLVNQPILNSHEFTPDRVGDVMRVSCGCSLLQCLPADAGNV